MVMLKKNSVSGTGVVQEIGLDDKLIDKLFIKEGNRIEYNVEMLKDRSLNGILFKKLGVEF